MTFLEAKVSQWRATAHTIWRVERPNVIGATVTFAKAVRSNHQLSCKVGGVLAKFLCTRLDGEDRIKEQEKGYMPKEKHQFGNDTQGEEGFVKKSQHVLDNGQLARVDSDHNLCEADLPK